MNHIKSTFSIKDLENFSGVKAHTIRIWEKRYGLLSPERTSTNIRLYSLESLKKLLNISLLNSEGIKISKIANYDNTTFDKILNDKISEKANKSQFINQLKIAMLNFDVLLFEEAYSQIRKVLSFSDVFKNYFIPFLKDIGLLWQSGSINLTHEHFISSIIKQKLLIETYNLQIKKVTKHNKLFILFLPDNEIHDIGLTYLHYEIMKAGYKSIMLGASVPIESLKPFTNDEQEVIFVSYFTVQPAVEKIPEYLKQFSKTLLLNSNANFYILGKQIDSIDEDSLAYNKVKPFYSLDSIIKNINA